ncbi:MAG: histidine phosphatase family protein [bacterium]
MPQKIIIVRHGETHYNVERRLQGWADIPLNENGHEQAQKVAERLSQEAIEIIYSSDHKRAYETASHIGAKNSLKPLKRKALRENRMGILEGWQWESEPDPIKQNLWSERDLAHNRGDTLWKPEGGESLKEHTARVKKFLKQIEIKHKTGVIMIVSHGGTINRIMEIYGCKKITDDYVRYKNTSVTILIKNKIGYQLYLHNDISHL